MIITDTFVMLNFPKTGSSFARAMLKQVHGYNEGWFNHVLHKALRRFRYGTLPNRALQKLDSLVNPDLSELIVPIIVRKTAGYRHSQHGTYVQIPEGHRHKTAVSIVRNPFARYVSAYRFGGWKKRYPRIYGEQIKHDFPSFPDLSFHEYYRMLHFYLQDYRLRAIKPKIDLGVTSVQFIQFYFRKPGRVLSMIDEEYIESDRPEEDMASVVFLHQEDLNRELHDFLLHRGYREEDIQFILEARKVNASENNDGPEDYFEYYTTELAAEVLRRDRLMFRLFPEYEVNPERGAWSRTGVANCRRPSHEAG